MERTSNTTAEELPSRRAILAAVLGAAAATAAAAVHPAEHASTANGDRLILGQANTANDATDLDGQLVVHSSAGSDDNPSDVAVQGTSLTGPVCWDTLGGVGCDQRGRSRRRRRSPWRCYRRLRGHLRIRAHCAREGRAAKPKQPRLRRCGQIVWDVDLRFKGSLPRLPLCFAILNSYRPGVFVTSVRADIPSGGMLRIYLNGAVTSRTAVAWFVLN